MRMPAPFESKESAFLMLLEAMDDTSHHDEDPQERRKAIRASIAQLKYAISLAQKFGLDPTMYHACEQRVDRLRKEVKEENDKLVAETRVYFEQRQQGIREKMPSDVKYLLVSTPEYDLEGMPVFGMACAILDALDEINAAGDAKDRFHTQVMNKMEMDIGVRGWRMAWKGKVCQAIEMLAKIFKKATIVVLMIDGGPECQYEQKEVNDSIRASFAATADLRIKSFHDFAAFKAYFEEQGAPVV